MKETKYLILLDHRNKIILLLLIKLLLIRILLAFFVEAVQIAEHIFKSIKLSEKIGSFFNHLGETQRKHNSPI